MAHTIYEHRVQALTLQKLELGMEQSDSEKFKEYRALEEQVQFATDMLSVSYRHPSKTRPSNPTPPEVIADNISDHGPTVPKQHDLFQPQTINDHLCPPWATTPHRISTAPATAIPCPTATATDHFTHYYYRTTP